MSLGHNSVCSWVRGLNKQAITENWDPVWLKTHVSVMTEPCLTLKRSFRLWLVIMSMRSGLHVQKFHGYKDLEVSLHPSPFHAFDIHSVFHSCSHTFTLKLMNHHINETPACRPDLIMNEVVAEIIFGSVSSLQSISMYLSIMGHMWPKWMEAYTKSCWQEWHSPITMLNIDETRIAYKDGLGSSSMSHGRAISRTKSIFEICKSILLEWLLAYGKGRSLFKISLNGGQNSDSSTERDCANWGNQCWIVAFRILNQGRILGFFQHAKGRYWHGHSDCLISVICTIWWLILIGSLGASTVRTRTRTLTLR